MTRQNISTGGPWEGKIGYSRAVKVGAHIQVSGSTAMTPLGLVGKGDPYAQTIQTFKTIGAALKQAGASLADAVRTRIYMANIDQWQEVGRAHGEVSSGPLGPPRPWSR